MANIYLNDASMATENKSNSNEQSSKAVKKAKRTVNPFWVTINRSRKVFDMQLDKSNEVKLRCLGHQLGRERDPQNFTSSLWSRWTGCSTVGVSPNSVRREKSNLARWRLTSSSSAVQLCTK